MIGEQPVTEYQPDAAFLAGLMGQDVVGGSVLAKFSLERLTAARRMKCMAPQLLSAESRAALCTTGNYPELQHDLICILWLCTLKDKIESAAEYRARVFTPALAYDNPEEARARAYAWAEENKLGDERSDEYFAAYKVFMKLVFAVESSVFEPVAEEDGTPPAIGPKAKPGPPNSPRSSRTRRKNPGTPQSTSGKP